jgi:hypothetical protein
MRKLFFAGVLATVMMLVLSMGVGAVSVPPCCA